MHYRNGSKGWIFALLLGILPLVAACSKSSGHSGDASYSWYYPDDGGDALSPRGTDAAYPAVALDSGGNMVFAWVQSDGLEDRIFMAEYRNGWLLPYDLGAAINPSGTQALSPRTATAPNGEALVVWQQSNGTHTQIYLSERLGGAWMHPLNLSDSISPTGSNATGPIVAMEEDGDAIVVWQQWDGSNWQVFKSERRGGVWDHPADLDDHISPAGEDVDDLALVLNETDDALIAWLQSDGSNKQVFLSQCLDGLWTHPADLAGAVSPAGTDADDPALALNDYGEALVVWEQQRLGVWQIFMGEYFNGSWSLPAGDENISPLGTDAWGIGLALNNSGDAVIAWEQFESSHFRIYKSERRNGVWDHPDFVDAISPAGSDAAGPTVVMSDGGETVIAWMQSDGVYKQIYRSDFRDGYWDHPLFLSHHVSPGGTHCLFGGQMGMDRYGNCILIWQQFDGQNWQLFNCQCRNDLWYAPLNYLSYFSLKGHDTQSPTFRMEPSGRGVAVWSQSDGTDERIFFSVYR